MFSLICVWINGWVNNGETVDLRRRRAHFDVIVMIATTHQLQYYYDYCWKSSAKELLLFVCLFLVFQRLANYVHQTIQSIGTLGKLAQRTELSFLRPYLSFEIYPSIAIYGHQYTSTATLKLTLWPCDVIWRHRPWSTLVQILAGCLTPPNQYLNQCWLLVSEVMLHSPDSNFTANAQVTIMYNGFKYYT